MLNSLPVGSSNEQVSAAGIRFVVAIAYRRRPSSPLGRSVGPFHVDQESQCGSLSCQEPFMGKKLYVGNLSYSADSSDLEQMFSRHGTVQSAEDIMDRLTNRTIRVG